MRPINTKYSLSQNHQTLTAVGSGDFFSHYPLKIFHEGEVILVKDEIPSDVYLIEQGRAKTYTIDSEGLVRIITYNHKGEVFPVGLVFNLIKKSQFFYEAYGKCVVRVIPVSDFVNYLDKNVAYMQVLYNKSIKQLISIMHRVDALIQSNSLRKVALSLLYMPDQLGINKRPHRPKLNVSVTQQEIANLIGLTRETIGSELKELQKMELINCSRNSYIIHMKKLRKYLDTSLK